VAGGTAGPPPLRKCPCRPWACNALPWLPLLRMIPWLRRLPLLIRLPLLRRLPWLRRIPWLPWLPWLAVPIRLVNSCNISVCFRWFSTVCAPVGQFRLPLLPWLTGYRFYVRNRAGGTGSGSGRGNPYILYFIIMTVALCVHLGSRLST
jgi:hypothetical protein